MDADDSNHSKARSLWEKILSDSGAVLFTSNYVIVETIALIQHRLGLEAVKVFNDDILPVVEVMWVDEETHMRALSSVLTARRRSLSLVDCVSFEVMRKAWIKRAFLLMLILRGAGLR